MDSIETAINLFLNNLSGNTRKSYSYDFKNSRTGLLVILKSNHLPPDAAIKMLKDAYGVEWIQHLKTVGCSPATISRRISAFKNLIGFCARRYSLPLSTTLFHGTLKDAKLLPKVDNLKLVPLGKIDKIISHCLNRQLSTLEMPDMLREVRNRTFFITLVETGMRVGEAMGLNRGAINWKEGRAVIVGKGEKPGIVRFSDRALEMLEWMKRGEEKANVKMPTSISITPLFVRYTKKRVKRLDTATGRDIIQRLGMEALGKEYIEGEITPHSLRHYFVMTILRKTGNIKTAMELARHSKISTTDRYTQVENPEMDAAYKKVFNS